MRIVLAAVDGELQLGADAIRGGNEDGIAKAGRLQVEERAEPAQPAKRAGTLRRAAAAA